MARERNPIPAHLRETVTRLDVAAAELYVQVAEEPEAAEALAERLAALASHFKGRAAAFHADL